MKVIVSFSGGKDSLASLLWVRNNLTKDFITKVVLMRKAQKDYFKCRTQQNLRKCKALETEIDGEIERVNSITGISSVSKEPRQTNLFTD